jgi:deazaflavin-dependent oxidoreductase (nitroreductase family)
MTPPRPILRIGWAVHRALFAATRGRVGTTRPGRWVGTLFLLSRGRKTGTVRRNGLFYVEDGDAFVVVASNAGETVDPSWWLNLQANPDAEVEIGRRRVAVRAREASPDEAEHLWPKLDAGYREYAAYRRRSTRPIPIVILEPAPGRSPA